MTPNVRRTRERQARGFTMPYKDYNKKMAEYMTKRYHRRRKLILERLGGKCNYCGSTEDLEIDHIDPFKKEVKINKRLSGLAESKSEAEIEKCQLLCKACNIERCNNRNRIYLVKPYTYLWYSVDYGEG